MTNRQHYKEILNTRFPSVLSIIIVDYCFYHIKSLSKVQEISTSIHKILYATDTMIIFNTNQTRSYHEYLLYKFDLLSQKKTGFYLTHMPQKYSEIEALHINTMFKYNNLYGMVGYYNFDSVLLFNNNFEYKSSVPLGVKIQECFGAAVCNGILYISCRIGDKCSNIIVITLDTKTDKVIGRKTINMDYYLYSPNTWITDISIYLYDKYSNYISNFSHTNSQLNTLFIEKHDCLTIINDQVLLIRDGQLIDYKVRVLCDKDDYSHGIENFLSDEMQLCNSDNYLFFCNMTKLIIYKINTSA